MMKRVVLTVALLMTAVPVLTAQEEPSAFRRFDINLNVVSFSRLDGVNAWGGQFGFVFRFNPTVGIVADFDGHQISHTSLWLYGYRVGPRVYHHYGSRLTAFGHFVIGSGRLEQSSESGGVTTTRSIDGFSMAGGGGLDVGIKPWLALRVGQLDYQYFRMQGIARDGLRAGGGVVFRMGK